jgi:large subunit ribosomal protein L31e
MPEESTTTEAMFNINLRRARDTPSPRRAKAAVNLVRKFISRHMKAEPENVWIDNQVAIYLWSRGARKPPTRVTVKATKFEDGLVEVTFPEE